MVGKDLLLNSHLADSLESLTVISGPKSIMFKPSSCAEQTSGSNLHVLVNTTYE